jgi:hypothetical protein
MLGRRWQFVQREEIMKSFAFRDRQSSELPIAWREAEYAALSASAENTCD